MVTDDRNAPEIVALVDTALRMLREGPKGLEWAVADVESIRAAFGALQAGPLLRAATLELFIVAEFLDHEKHSPVAARQLREIGATSRGLLRPAHADAERAARDAQQRAHLIGAAPDGARLAPPAPRELRNSVLDLLCRRPQPR